ncbi:MAG: glycoside hydrolase family 127 protein [Firmicutes bacterium]|nr:glycoside hydrolase family 127 protein [Bacillota bacterium]
MNTKNFIKTVPMEQVEVRDSFWNRYMEVVRTSMIPYQWKALHDEVEGATPSYCIHNFLVAAGLKEGKHGGYVFQDSDLAKWIEAASYSLIHHPDAVLEKDLDDLIELIGKAQQPDGYLDTYYIITGLDKRFTDLQNNHELYCCGHMLEAAIAFYRATGKRSLLDIMLRFVDLIDRMFGPEENKKHGYPGHEEIELALMKLYRITNDPKHLRLAKYFIDQRGQSPNYFEEEGKGRNFYWANSHFKYQYYQAGKPLREQTVAEGHAVRAMYLYTGAADVAKETADEDLYQVLRTLWKNVTRRQMYITGSVGASDYGEAFSYDYDLPNDTVYGETCAAIGLAFWAHRMLGIEPRGEYADVLEKVLYNGTISGMQLDGTKFFYVNPLEVVPEASEKAYVYSHVKPERQKWFGCACCPPNLARLIESLPEYAYGIREKTLFVHLYLGGRADLRPQGIPACLEVETQYPWKGNIRMTVRADQAEQWQLALRIPGWCGKYALRVNGEAVEAAIRDGYAVIDRVFRDGDIVELELDMPVEKMQACPRVREDIGKIAIMRGPVVYCLEEADNGPQLARIRLTNAPFTVTYEPELLSGVAVIRTQGEYLEGDWGEDLYRKAADEKWIPKDLTLIPYYAWANRQKGEMRVWIQS